MGNTDDTEHCTFCLLWAAVFIESYLVDTKQIQIRRNKRYSFYIMQHFILSFFLFLLVGRILFVTSWLFLFFVHNLYSCVGIFFRDLLRGSDFAGSFFENLSTACGKRYDV